MTEIFSFKGRIRRSTFWGLFALLILISAMAQAAIAVDVESSDPGLLSMLGLAGTILTSWACLATYAKRWHDIGQSGWMSLTILIPFLGFFIILYLGFSRGDIGSNKFGEEPVRPEPLQVSGLEFSDERIKAEPPEDERA